MIKHTLAPHVKEIISRLQSAGYETYLVGGAVRDLRLGMMPKDFDISSSATPEQIKSVFGKKNARIIGKRFRLVHYYHGREIVEISTFRSKPNKINNFRHHDHKEWRDNIYGNSREDAWRRDFTVNAIFYDPAKEEFLDFTGMGIRDLENGVVRCIGNPEERITEDPVRIIRALKLRAQYGFTIEDETENAMLHNMELISKCSISRLSLEIQKILHKPFSHKILQIFQEYGALKELLPFLHRKWDSPEIKYMLELLEERNKRLLEGCYRDSVSVAIAACVLPFAEKNLGKQFELWEQKHGVESYLRELLSEIFHPCLFPRQVTTASVLTLFLQPFLKSMSSKKSIHKHQRLSNAKELLFIQNKLKWHEPCLEAFWTEQSTQKHT